MKTIAIIKLFVVLCCYTPDERGGYVYDVQAVDDTTRYGTVYSLTKYNKNDTIRIEINNLPDN
jgi:hypothetical protein